MSSWWNQLGLRFDVRSPLSPPPENRALVIEALRLAGRTDLIGFEKGCLIRPYVKKKAKTSEKQEKPNRGSPGSHKAKTRSRKGKK